MTPALITLLTDFGIKDSYVASMKGVILGLCPGAHLVDISHLIPPQDIRSGAFLLGQVYTDFPVGAIHVVVVDPGVGTNRRGLAMEAGGYFFVGPDNGIFSLVLKRERSVKARSLEVPGFWRSNVSTTFHGRDVFAPVAAHLANGVDLESLGPEWSPLIAPWSNPVEEEGRVSGEVVYIDHFGNAISNLERKDLHLFPRLDDILVVIEERVIGGMVQTYGEAPWNALVALIGSSGCLEIAVNGGSAAETLGISPGSRIEVRRRK